MKKWWVGFKNEFQSRVLSSKKRLIKFFGISIIPIIYAIVCILAFWNPVPGIGNAPIAILDTDKKVYIYKEKDTSGGINPSSKNIKYKFGAIKKDGEVIDASSFNYDSLTKYLEDISKNGGKLETNTGEFDLKDSEEAKKNIYTISAWELIKNGFNEKDVPSTDDESTIFTTDEISDQKIKFTNIHYIKGNKALDEYKGKKYYVQLLIPDKYIEDMVYVLGGGLNDSTTKTQNTKLDLGELDRIINNKLKIWTTFERNFLFGYYMNTLNSFKEAIPIKLIPKLFDKEINNIKDKISNHFDQYYKPKDGDYLGKTGSTFPKGIEYEKLELSSKENIMVSDEGISTSGAYGPGNESKLDNIKDGNLTMFGKVDKDTMLLEDANIKTNSKLTKMIEKIEVNGIEDIPGMSSIMPDVKKYIGFMKVIKDNAHILNKLLFDYAHGLDWTKDDQSFSIDKTHFGDIGMDETIINLIPKKASFKSIIMLLKIKHIEPPEILNPNKENSFKPYNIFKDNKNPTKNFNGVYEENLQINIDIWAKINGFTGTGEFKDNIKFIIDKIIGAIDFKPTKISNLAPLDIEIQGADNAIYGIGLGEFFLLIGMYVGTIVQTFVFDRAKRTKNLLPSQYYLSKTALMWSTGMIQVTLLTLAVTAAGWYVLGATSILLLWLWLMLTQTMFVVTIQTFWFSLKDETIGKFLAIIYMVMNLAAGWGTFPSFMQSNFFYGISYITEFTYSLHGMGSIIYGIGEIGINTSDTLYILKQVGILMIFGLVFIIAGLFFSRNRVKEMQYGSYRAKYVAEMISISKNYKDLLDKFRTKVEIKVSDKNKSVSKEIKDKYKYNWKVFEKNEVYDELVELMRIHHPLEGQFKWFKNKKRDRVLKPNYSDDDVISRNDDVTV